MRSIVILLFCEAKHYDYYYLIYSFYYSFHARHIFTITYYYSFHVRNIIVTTIFYIISAGSAGYQQFEKATLLPFRKTILPYSTNYLTRSVWLLVNYYQLLLLSVVVIISYKKYLYNVNLFVHQNILYIIVSSYPNNIV